MKGIVLALALVSCTATAQPEVWVFGDSLSSSATSWPAVITELDKDSTTPERDSFGHIRVGAQGLLSFTDVYGAKVFETPRWINCTPGPNSPEVKVILWLGSNDARFDTPRDQFQQHVWEEVEFLTEKGCDPLIVLPPVPLTDNPAYNEYIDRRGIIIQAADHHGARVIDPPFNWAMTTDGVHPNDLQSWLLAIYFIKELGLDED